MSVLYVTLINVILLFIVYLVLSHKINKNSTSALLDKYAREVESLIVELNRTLDDVLNLSEERVNELKKLIRKAEKVLVSDRPSPGAPSPGGLSPGGAGAAESAVSGVKTAAGDGVSRGVHDAERTKKTEAKSARRNAGDDRPVSVPPVSVSTVSVPLYDMRGKKVDILPAVEEEHRESPRTSNIFERTRHLLSMGHSKEEIARMLNLSRAEMEFLASLHNK